MVNPLCYRPFRHSIGLNIALTPRLARRLGESKTLPAFRPPLLPPASFSATRLFLGLQPIYRILFRSSPQSSQAPVTLRPCRCNQAGACRWCRCLRIIRHYPPFSRCQEGRRGAPFEGIKFWYVTPSRNFYFKIFYFSDRIKCRANLL